MKKFVSILTVVAMVAACSTSAFAAGSPTTPTDIQEIEIIHDQFNDVGADEDKGETVVNYGGGSTSSGNTSSGNTSGGSTVTTGGSNTTPTGNTNGGGTTDPKTDDKKETSDNPTADPSKYPEGSPARKLAEALSSASKLEFKNAEEMVKFFADLLGIEIADLPANFTIVTNALNLGDAVGVKVVKNEENGSCTVTVGQNELTKNHDDDLVGLVASAKADEKGEVCIIKKDANGNLTFDTKITEGAFVIVLKTDAE